MSIDGRDERDVEVLALAFAVDRIHDRDVVEQVVEMCTTRWFPRGDCCLVYENVEIGHPSAGAQMFLSYGSPEAQIERDKVSEPPMTCPDGLPNNDGGTINWRYRLQFIIDPELSAGTL